MTTNYARDTMFACHDCGHDTLRMGEYYMVHDDLWWSVVGEEPMLCIGCLERRLGFKLESSDFITCLLNDGTFPQSLRLRSRLRRIPISV